MRRALLALCALVAAGCFLYVGVWFWDGLSQRNRDGAHAAAFHEASASNANTAGGTAVPAANGASAVDTDDKVPYDRFAPLAAVNPDVAGWITIEGTAVDYPVVRAQDNEHYLTIDFEGNPSKRGSIFMDYRCAPGDPLTILYGHRMKDGTMFRDVGRYVETDFANAHPQMRFIPRDGEERVYALEDVIRWDTSVDDGADFYERMSDLSASGGRLLVLVTCDSDDTVRVVVIARAAE